MPRRIIDLSTPVEVDHFRWKVDRKKIRSHEAGDVAEVTWTGWTVHGFTHMDAPRHFSPTGITTDDIPLDSVMGDAAVVDVSSVGANAPITEEVVAEAGAHIRRGDIVLLRAGWDSVESIRTPEFWTRAPYVTEEAARWLLGREIKAIAYDFPQDYCIRHLVLGDREPALEENVTHVVLLLNGVIMFEYLCNMNAITTDRVHFIGLPIKIPGSDGAPVRAIAIQED